MYAKVVPFAKLPRKFEAFDYLVPQEFKKKIKTGHIVAVYFHGQKIYGLVEKIESHSDIQATKLKPILSITDIVIPQYFIDLISWASRYYFVSPSLLYKMLIPKEAKLKKTYLEYPQKNLALNKEEAANVISSLKNFISEKNNFFLYDNNSKETLAVLIKLSEKELQNKKQILILVPTVPDIDSIAPYLNLIFNNRLIFFGGKLSAGEKYSIWKKLANNEPAVILGTRQACFLPLKNLSLICFLNYTSRDHKQWDMNPRYDARKIAKKLQELQGTKIVRSDILPDLQIYKELNGGEITPLNEAASQPQFSLVDMKQEKNSASPLFSYPLYEMIKASENQKIILFLNRRDTDSLLICNDCRHTFLCTSAGCGRPYYLDKNLFLCYHCRTEKPIASACPKCDGTRLKPINSGINTIKKIIGAEFPNIKIATVGKAQKIFDKNFGVLITTDYFWKNILPQLSGEKIYGAAILDFDFYLNRPEFNQSETAIAALYRIFRFAKNFSAQKIIIQTGCPENIIWNGWQNFYKKELEERAALNYPPFTKLVKIICKNSDKLALDYEAKKLYTKLIQQSFSATPPFSPYVKKRTKNFIQHIILKENDDNKLSILKDIIPDEYQIDIDPISIY